jgi:putative CocE/NonD family hydrolase
MMVWLQSSARVRFLCLTSILLIASAPAHAQQTRAGFLPVNAQIGNYVGRDVMIPMRDGVQLHAEIWRPKNVAAKLPILIQRSPYGFELPTVQRYFAVQYKELAADGYIFVLQDIRGRFGSEGQFVMLRPKSTKPGGIDEATDTYDSIDWLIKHLPDNNGKVGIFGVSYLGWTTAMSTIHPHPALKAISVQASPEDMFIGDDFHHNGAFRLDYGWEYAAALETNGRTMKAFSFGADDPYDWYLKQARLADLDTKYLGQRLPTWQNFVQHPNYDAYWQAQVTTTQMPAHVAVPDLIVAGWWDQEDFYGPLTIYKREQQRDPNNKSFLVVGPWNHGGWAKSNGKSYGPFDFGSATADYFRAKAEVPWFRYWLKGEGALDQPKALIFETGSNRWKRYSAWPPRAGISEQNLYFHAAGKLSFDAPTRADAKPDSFVSDPNHPVPYRERPILPMESRKSTWSTWLADDQAPFAKRADVLSWQTGVLQNDVTIRGDVLAKLYASTTGTDADWIVKLIDIYPSDAGTPAALRGRQLIIADDVFRGRFRKSFEHPAPIAPGKVLDYAIDLHSASHVFLKGHRIAVQVQSTWFPLIDRNPQVFVPSIFKARRSQYKVQNHSIFHTPQYPSAIAVDVASKP